MIIVNLRDKENASMSATDLILPIVPARYKEKVSSAIAKYENEITEVLNAAHVHMETTRNRGLVPQSSDYLAIPRRIGSVYMRSAHLRYGRFGHSYWCLSNITLNDKVCGKGMFTALIYGFIAIALKNKWIFSVENPLELRLQKRLEDIGFECQSKDFLGCGTYYYLLPEEILVSPYPHANIGMYGV